MKAAPLTVPWACASEPETPTDLLRRAEGDEQRQREGDREDGDGRRRRRPAAAPRRRVHGVSAGHLPAVPRRVDERVCVGAHARIYRDEAGLV